MNGMPLVVHIRIADAVIDHSRDGSEVASITQMNAILTEDIVRPSSQMSISNELMCDFSHERWYDGNASLNSRARAQSQHQFCCIKKWSH